MLGKCVSLLSETVCRLGLLGGIVGAVLDGAVIKSKLILRKESSRTVQQITNDGGVSMAVTGFTHLAQEVQFMDGRYGHCTVALV